MFSAFMMSLKLIKYASEVALYICNKVIFGGVSLKVASL